MPNSTPPVLETLIDRQDYQPPAAGEAAMVQHPRKIRTNPGVFRVIVTQNLFHACG